MCCVYKGSTSTTFTVVSGVNHLTLRCQQLDTASHLFRPHFSHPIPAVASLCKRGLGYPGGGGGEKTDKCANSTRAGNPVGGVVGLRHVGS